VPLSRLRGVRGRQTFVPSVFSVIAVFGYRAHVPGNPREQIQTAAEQSTLQVSQSFQTSRTIHDAKLELLLRAVDAGVNGDRSGGHPATSPGRASLDTLGDRQLAGIRSATSACSLASAWSNVARRAEYERAR
jgi:hypothetical protein